MIIYEEDIIQLIIWVGRMIAGDEEPDLQGIWDNLHAILSKAG